MAAAIPLVLSAVGTAGTIYAANKASKGGALQPTPAEPTVDEAVKNRDELDRIRRRRGVLATIAGGQSASATPTVGTKTLLG